MRISSNSAHSLQIIKCGALSAQKCANISMHLRHKLTSLHLFAILHKELNLRVFV